jgi:hypothetical protein
MKLFLSLTFITICFTSNSQNLVPNPSFEEFTDCPLGVSELENLCENWVGWSESPDYYNVCNNELNGSVGIPENVIGFQEALSGVAYSGLGTYAFTDPNIREYIAVQLSEDLAAGEEYYVMFFASLYDGGSQTDFHCGTNHIGLRFFEDPDYNSDLNPFQPDNFAHLDYSEILLDDTNWVKIEGWVTATQAYNWLAIGNFFTDENTDIEILDEGNECFGIYYIENVCVSPTQAGCDQLLSRNETDPSASIRVYPNPATSLVTIDAGSHKIQSLQLLDLSGKLVSKTIVYNLQSAQINTSDLAIGVYFLKVQTEKEFYTHRILKQ